MVYDVLIASPSDVRAERDAVESAMLDWNAANGRLGVQLRPVRWERDSVPVMGVAPQEALNEQFVKSCDLGVGVFWSRVGTATANAVSGSVEEIELLIGQGKRVLVYFSLRELPPDSDESQTSLLADFRTKCQQTGLYAEFAQPEDLKYRVFKDLSACVPPLHESLGQQAVTQVTAKFAIPVEDVVAEEVGRPEFSVVNVGASRRAEAFRPEFRVAQVGGAAIQGFEWRLHALGVAGEWRTVSGTALERTHFVDVLNLGEGMPVAVGDMFFLLRFQWRGRWYHQRHRWPLTSLTGVGRTIFDIGAEMLPPSYWSASEPQEFPP